MTDGLIILEIFFITLGMFFFGLVFRHIFGLNKEGMEKYREKAKQIQERMKNAQLVGDARMMQETQRDSMELTKEMMKKQFVPLCLRCVIFLGIFALLGAIFAPYSSGLIIFIPIFGNIFGTGWAAVYILFSLGFSLIYFISKKIYEKLTGKQTKSITGDMMDMLSPDQSAKYDIMDYSTKKSSEIKKASQKSTNNMKKGDNWKDKIDS